MPRSLLPPAPGEEIPPCWGGGGGRGWSFAVTGQSWMWMLCTHTHQGLKASFLEVCDDRKPEHGVGMKPQAPAGVQTLPPGLQGLREPSVHIETGSAASLMSICSLRLGVTVTESSLVLPPPARDTAPFQSPAPGVTVLHCGGQGKIRSFIFDSYLWVPAAGRRASGTE